MKIDLSPFTKNLGNFAALAISSLVATTALAGPNQLDILGLVPGVSERDKLREADVKPYNNLYDNSRLEIGGYVMTCDSSFINGKLAILDCSTGKDLDKDFQYTEASNAEVHATLKTGFTRKFGNPDMVTAESVRTLFGVEHKQEIVTWIDKRGNRLQLMSIYEFVSKGRVVLASAEFLKEAAKQNAAKEAQRKF